MIALIFATLNAGVVVGLRKSIRRRCRDRSSGHHEIRA
jgi:hypothetical protein